jgi:nucleotide-binding universal stress UspA family protein
MPVDRADGILKASRKGAEMFETIVWATDGYEFADRALTTVTELARIHNSKIVAVHANKLIPSRYGTTPTLAAEPDLRDKIAHQVARLEAEGYVAELRIVTGSYDVARLIADAAADVDAGLIVAGTHGYGGFKAAVVGSVARALLHASTCPVLVVPPEREVAVAAELRETAGVA